MWLRSSAYLGRYGTPRYGTPRHTVVPDSGLGRTPDVFHIENVFDIESIISKIRSIKGVLKADAYQPIRIKCREGWLKKKIRNKILSI